MPQNKYAFARYRVIDRLLQSGHLVTTTDIVEACTKQMGTTVSPRQIQHDINYMRGDTPFGYGAPIDSSKKGHRYTEHFTLDQFQLSKEELSVLEIAASLIYQFRGLGFLKHIASAIEKVKWGVAMTGKVAPKNSLYNKVRPESVNGLAWQAHFPIVLEALEGDQKVEIEYQKFNDEKPTSRTVHPYLLKEYLNRWYLVGYCEKQKALRSFGLDRIHNVRVLDEAIPKNADPFDPEEYYKSTFGVTGSSGTPSKIVLEFKKAAGKYVLTLPLHDSQEVLLNEKECIRVSIVVYPTIEVYMKILSYGDEVKVVSPPEVVDEIKRRLTAAYKQY